MKSVEVGGVGLERMNVWAIEAVKGMKEERWSKKLLKMLFRGYFRKEWF